MGTEAGRVIHNHSFGLQFMYLMVLDEFVFHNTLILATSVSNVILQTRSNGHRL